MPPSRAPKSWDPGAPTWPRLSSTARLRHEWQSIYSGIDAGVLHQRQLDSINNVAFTHKLVQARPSSFKARSSSFNLVQTPSTSSKLVQARPSSSNLVQARPSSFKKFSLRSVILSMLTEPNESLLNAEFMTYDFYNLLLYSLILPAFFLS